MKAKKMPPLAVTPEQLKLMSFGPRREIIASLANDKDLSAGDLAEHLHRPVTGLYRHLELLLDAGLIKQSGRRPGAKRPEALYSLTFRTFSIEKAIQSAKGRAAISEAATRYATATARKIDRAIKTGKARLSGVDANTTFGVMDLQLDRAGLIEFRRLMADFIVAARKLRVRRDAARETISVTILLAPQV
jgi:DNA-binding transcriptional ArsR family regulator